jgi:hypothetical protein
MLIKMFLKTEKENGSEAELGGTHPVIPDTGKC